MCATEQQSLPLEFSRSATIVSVRIRRPSTPQPEIRCIQCELPIPGIKRATPSPEHAPALPSTVAEIADVIGRDAAIQLAHARAATRNLYVPHNMPDGHWLPRMIGMDAASRLQRVYSGELIPIATCRDMDRHERNRSIAEDHSAGFSIRHLATRYGLTTRRIGMILARRVPTKRKSEADSHR